MGPRAGLGEPHGAPARSYFRILNKRTGGRPKLAFRLDETQKSLASALFPTWFRDGTQNANLHFASTKRKTALASTLFPTCFLKVFFDVFCSGRAPPTSRAPNNFASPGRKGEIRGVLNKRDIPVVLQNHCFYRMIQPMQL